MIKPPFIGGGLFGDPAIKTAVLALLEKQLNAIIGLDPVIVRQLGAMEGRVVEIHCLEPDVQCYLYLEASGVRLAGYHEGSVDASIKGTLVAFTELASNRALDIGDVAGLESGGDPDILEQLSQAHRSAELDWEALLCRCFGDVGGHMLAQGFRFASRQAEKVRTVAADNLGEYLQEELRLLPSRNEVEAFSSDIAELQYAVDNLERLVNNAAKKP